MRWRCPGFDQEIEWNSQCHVNELVVESQAYWRQLIQDLYDHQEDGSGISLTKDGHALDFSSDVEVVTNPLNLDFNHRRVMLNLFKLLTNTALSENHYLPTQQIKTQVASYIVDLVESSQINFQVATDDFSLTQLAKAVNLHLVSDDNLLVRLTEYQEIMRDLGQTKLLIWLNLRSFLDDNELAQLVTANAERELDCLLLESTARNKLINVPRMIIDQDQCLI